MNNIKLQTIGDSSQNERYLRKLIRDNSRPVNTSVRTPNIGVLNEISTQTEDAINDYKYIKELLTEVKLVQQIFISSIATSTVSKNLNDVEYNITVSDNGYNGKIYGKLLSVVADYYKNVYKIADIIPDIISKALFEAGSKPYLILPETSLDNMIQSAVSLESAIDYNQVAKETFGSSSGMVMRGYLGLVKESKNDDFSFEMQDIGLRTVALNELYLGKTKELKTMISDNFDIMKRPKLIDRQRQAMLAQSIVGSLPVSGVALESNDPKSHEEKVRQEKLRKELIKEIFQKTHGVKHINSVPVVHHTDTKEYGEPTVIDLPAGSVIPIHPAGDPIHPVGYLVLNDETGNPIDTGPYITYYRQNRMRSDQGSAITASLRNAAATMGMGHNLGSDAQIKDLDQLADFATELIEHDIIQRCANSPYGQVELGGNKDEVARVMLARLMKNQRTVLLFVPAELMAYYAFDYNEYGIGVSLIEQTKMLSVMRINTMLANNIGVQRNAIGTTTLDITLSPNDMEPRKTVQEIVGEHMFNRSSGLNLMSTDPLTSIKQMQRAGVQVAVSGNPNYPETAVKITDSNNQRAVVDPEFLNDQRRQWLMGFGLIPELVDATGNIEFAAQILSSNAMFARMIAIMKAIMSKHVTKHIRTMTLFSSRLRSELMEVISQNAADIPKEFKDAEFTGDELHNAVLTDFITRLLFTLAPLSSTTNTQILDDFNARKSLAEAAVSEFVDAEVLPEEFMGKLAEHGVSVEVYKKRLVAAIMRRYVRENNLAPELSDLGIKDDDGSFLGDAVSEILDHEDSIRNVLLDFIIEQTKRITDFNEDADKKIIKTETKIGPIVEGTEGMDSGDEFSDTGSTPEETEGGEDDWGSPGFGEPEETQEEEGEETPPDEGETPPEDEEQPEDEVDEGKSE